MKKNLFSIIICVLLIINIVFSALLTFTMVPAISNSNELIAKVASAIDLEVESYGTTGVDSVPIENIEVYNIADSMTINLKKGEDGADHFAVVSVSLSVDKESEGYEKYFATISEKESLIKDKIRSVVSSYTIDQIKDDENAVLEEILESLQALFNSDFIISVSFSSAVYQ
ncbi:Flagellar basal body-associated protein FliL [Acetitomaculum ruminis DSM 5522]|uniref:Flagellar protein FliL n=1 Tax=Acetitomaculum ruminis DSM 5522 TaxID=1120918 RepID=A0A1I0ZL93_9FIRM|nr:flagellar basal body-associated FliL family protein [Acetitomaculum ruminis]SFB25148.1 Flagellar basal body-associated protein FliL [Acetitomaculum ruminis DSM 5522]